MRRVACCMACVVSCAVRHSCRRRSRRSTKTSSHPSTKRPRSAAPRPPARACMHPTSPATRPPLAPQRLRVHAWYVPRMVRGVTSTDAPAHACVRARLWVQATKQRLFKAVSNNILFNHLDENQRDVVVAAMFRVDKKAGDTIITQARTPWSQRWHRLQCTS